MPRIPLFPLEVVLFPGAPLPLHIFEPRYKLMIGHCIEHSTGFGVALSREEGIAAVGCTAEIIKLVKRYDDGRMDILTMGESPFIVKEMHTNEPYLEVDAEFLEDDFSGILEEVLLKLAQTFERCYQLVHRQGSPTLERGPEISIAFQIAGFLPLDLDVKQTLLEIRRETERQDHLLATLEEWLPQLERLHRVRGKAGGNGHAL
jgi:Lon protease-like protein